MKSTARLNSDICLIIAAGMGTRMSHRIDSKPLLGVHGFVLIERIMMDARAAGAEHFVVVSGYNGDKLRKYIDQFALREQMHVRHVENDEYKRGNGVSVYKAADVIQKPFFLLMADHIFDYTILRDMNSAPMGDAKLMLAVDYNLKNPNVDLSDVTRVVADNGYITAIGKEIDKHNAYDTGMFLCTPDLFGALKQSIQSGDESLSAGVRMLAQQKAAKVFDIKGRLWIDIDDENAYHKAIQAIPATE